MGLFEFVYAIERNSNFERADCTARAVMDAIPTSPPAPVTYRRTSRRRMFSIDYDDDDDDDLHDSDDGDEPASQSASQPTSQPASQR